MNRWIMPLVFCFVGSLLGACSSNGTAPADTAQSALTAQEVVEQCVADDLLDLAGLLELIQGLGSDGAEIPQPELDLLRILVDGTIGWSFDLDGDDQNDLSGTIGFKNAAGETTIPIDITDLIGGATPDIAQILADLPDGTTLNLTFEFLGNLLAQGAGNGGDLSILFDGGAIVEVDGNGVFTTDTCSFTFGFDDIGAFDAAGGGFPVATLNFSADVDGQTLGGDIGLDGTSIARIITRSDGLPETFLLDLATGALVE